MNLPRPVLLMSDAELLAELQSAVGLSVAVIERAAELYAEAVRRGLDVQLRSVAMRAFLPRVAGHTLAAEAIVAFSDLPKLLTAIGRLPVALQRELAAGRLIDVVLVVREPAVPVHARDTYPSFIETAFKEDRIATPEEQTAALIRRREREEAKVRRLVEKLRRQLEREGGLTVRRAVELAIAANWRPRSEWE